MVPVAGTLEEVPAAGTLEEDPAAGTLEEDPAAGTLEEVPAAGTLVEVPAGKFIGVSLGLTGIVLDVATGSLKGVLSDGTDEGVLLFTSVGELVASPEFRKISSGLKTKGFSSSLLEGSSLLGGTPAGESFESAGVLEEEPPEEGIKPDTVPEKFLIPSMT